MIDRMLFVCIFFVLCSNEIFSSKVPIQTFAPRPIHLTINDLPSPFHTESAAKPSIIVPPTTNGTLLVPNENFRVTIFRKGLQSPRQMIYTPTGEILVTDGRGSRIVILYDNETSVFADQSNGIAQAFGMAFVQDWFYVANAGDLRRYRYQNGNRQLQGTGEILLRYERNGHWTRNLIVSPSGDRLFVTIGSASNVDIEYPPRAAVIMANLDGSQNETYSWGLRNPVGIDFHPKTGDLYVAVQERDRLGDDLVPDYFTRIQKNEFYGWPFAYLSPKHVDPRRRFDNGSSERPDLVEQTRTPDVLFRSHSAVLGMQFYRGEQFPSHYHNGAFAALHGSWNREEGTGFNVVFIPFGDDYRPKGYYEEFLTGFLIDPSGPRTFGRPVGILEMKDGSLLISEDGNGYLYRIEYMANEILKSTALAKTSTGERMIIDRILIVFLNIFLLHMILKH